MSLLSAFFSFFFFNDTATTEIYTLSLHDALPICEGERDAADLGLLEHIEQAKAHLELSVGKPLRLPDDYRIGEAALRSEEHTSELQSQSNLVCRLLLEKKKKKKMS